MASPDPLPLDLHQTVAALSRRFETCHLLALADVVDELPRRAITRAEAECLMRGLADHGLSVIDGDAADLAARDGPATTT